MQTRKIDLHEDIRSLSDFKRNTNECLSRLKDSGNPLILTIHGRAEVVVQDASAYQKLMERIDALEALEGIQRGVADVAAGRVTTLAALENEFQAKHAIPGSARR